MLRPAAVMVAALLLAGCVPNEPVVTPPPEPQATPIFASDEDALAAATDAYAKYLEVSDAISADGGKHAERMSPFVTSEQLINETAGFAALMAVLHKTQGSSTFQIARLQQYDDFRNETATVSVYLCLDVTGVRVLDDSDRDVTPVRRTSVVPLEVGFNVDTSNGLVMLVERSEPWSGQDFCK